MKNPVVSTNTLKRAKSKKNLRNLPRYFDKIEKPYVFIFNQKNVPAKKIHQKLIYLKKQNIQAFFIKNSFLKVLLPSEDLSLKGTLFSFVCEDLNRGFEVCEELSKASYSYYKDGDVVEDDHVIKAQVTNLKAGLVLSLFQKKLKVKVNRGNLEIVQPYLLKKGDLVDSDVSKILTSLGKNLKTQRLDLQQVLRLKKPLSLDLKSFVLDKGTKVFDSVKELNCKLNCSYLPLGFETHLKKISRFKFSNLSFFNSHTTQ